MFKPNRMLKVVSIIMIVLSVISILSVAASYFIIQNLEVPGLDMSAYREMVTPVSVAISILAAVVMLAASIMALTGKSLKVCLVLMGAYLLYLVIANIVNAVKTGFSPLIVVDFILPVLYMWGVYQSKE